MVTIVTSKLITRDHSLYWMGIATLAILLFHIGQNESSHIVHKGINFIFSKGSIGVNIFFFLSGYGLANSFNKNSLKVFYFNRFKRLYPMMFFFHGSIVLYKRWFLINVPMGYYKACNWN